MKSLSLLPHSIHILFLCLSCNLIVNCTSSTPETSSEKKKPSVVKVVEKNGQYEMTVNNKAFDVKGAGIADADRQKVQALKNAGGNAFRTWDIANLGRDLAIAEEFDLMVAVGFATGKELTGFDYNDQTAIKEQFEQVTRTIDQYKNHPNILMWVIGNEPNLLFDEVGKPKRVNPKVYSAMSDIIDYVHQTDPNHPVTFTLAGAHPKNIQHVVSLAPNIDIICVQLYGDLTNLSKNIIDSGINKPFMVTEFGPLGHWERPTTQWNREIEEASLAKAKGMATRMKNSIINDKTGKVVGSFAFFWGQKQERTPTWYGMFNESGEQTARIDELTRIWTGQYPKNRAPLTSDITINNLQATDSIRLIQGQQASVTVKVLDPDNDPLNYKWTLMDEVKTRSQGGHFEAKPQTLKLNIIEQKDGPGFTTIIFETPKKSGEYRLFSYTYDENNHVGNANIPFWVE